MPQFDKLNFLTQIYWTFFFFFSFYFMIVGKYLPFFTNILKTRTKILYINIYRKKVDKIPYKISNSLLTNFILDINHSI